MIKMNKIKYGIIGFGIGIVTTVMSMMAYNHFTRPDFSYNFKNESTKFRESVTTRGTDKVEPHTSGTIYWSTQGRSFNDIFDEHSLKRLRKEMESRDISPEKEPLSKLEIKIWKK